MIWLWITLAFYATVAAVVAFIAVFRPTPGPTPEEDQEQMEILAKRRDRSIPDPYGWGEAE